MEKKLSDTQTCYTNGKLYGSREIQYFEVKDTRTPYAKPFKFSYSHVEKTFVDTNSGSFGRNDPKDLIRKEYGLA